MNFLKRIYQKNCRYDCKELSDAYNEINIMKKEKRENEYFRSSLEYLQYFNEINEDIIYFSKFKNFYFCITAFHQYSYLNKINNLDFFAYSFDNSSNFPKSVYTLNTTFIYDNNKNFFHIHIIDFIGTINEGHGSLVMQNFLKYVKLFRPSKITGSLSEVDLLDENDLKHKDRLYHFYKKFGFEIINNKEICLILEK